MYLVDANAGTVVPDKQRGSCGFTGYIRFSPCGRGLAAPMDNGHLLLLDAYSGANRHSIQLGGQFIFDLAYSPCGRRLDISMNEQLLLLNAECGAVIHSIPLRA